MSHTVEMQEEIEVESPEWTESRCRYCKRKYMELPELVLKGYRVCPRCED